SEGGQREVMVVRDVREVMVVREVSQVMVVREAREVMVVREVREVMVTVDSSTFRFEEEAGNTRELIVNKHRGLSLAMIHLQKTVDQMQCPHSKNETLVELGPDEPVTAKYASLWKQGIDTSLESVNGKTDHARLHRQSSHLVKDFHTTSFEPETDTSALTPPDNTLGPDTDRDDPYLSALFGGTPRQKNRGSTSGVRQGASGVRQGASGVRQGASGVRQGASGVRQEASGVPQGSVNGSVSRTHTSGIKSLQTAKSGTSATEPSVGVRLPKARRSLGCQSVAASGIIALSGSVPQGSVAGPGYFLRYCDQTLPGGGWTVIQRRGPLRGSTGPHTPYNFTRSWEEYKRGFGDMDGEFWWGNDNIHRLSQEQPLMLRFDLWDFEGNHAVAEYSSFRLANESSQYELSVSGYQGNASDSFSAHDKFRFSTYDRDNDRAPDCCPCAPAYGGGWWFFRWVLAITLSFRSIIQG
ncbi:Fibrinogen alpha/beta/gamma chain C-terminal globular domain, partial [Trinorchestia longiramus]